ncbi:MAG: hypothetical protein IH946_08970 [Bacteroidetes bacterium]|nr:hypothetical protein [Bacteroidota bacterium]
MKQDANINENNEIIIDLLKNNVSYYKEKLDSITMELAVVNETEYEELNGNFDQMLDELTFTLRHLTFFMRIEQKKQFATTLSRA